MFSFRQFKIHRRSLLVTAAGLAAFFSLPRTSRGGGTDTVDRFPRVAPPHSKTTDAPSGDQIAGAIDLKTVGPTQQVTSIRYSDDTYYVTTASGASVAFPEFNLRFKTDSGARGPAKNRPVLLPASMRTDRAFLVFSDPREINAFITEHATAHTQS